MSEHIIVTTGIYDVIKDQLRRKKVTPEQEIRLANELKTAKQVLRSDSNTTLCLIGLEP